MGDPIAGLEANRQDLERRAADGDPQALRTLQDRNLAGDAKIFFDELKLVRHRLPRETFQQMMQATYGWDPGRFDRIEARGRADGYEIRYPDDEERNAPAPPPIVETPIARARRQQFEVVHRATLDLHRAFSQALDRWFAKRDELIALHGRMADHERRVREFEIDVAVSERRVREKLERFGPRIQTLRRSWRIAYDGHRAARDRATQQELAREVSRLKAEWDGAQAEAAEAQRELEQNATRRQAFARESEAFARQRETLDRELELRKRETNAAEDAYRRKQEELYRTFEYPDRPEDLNAWVRHRRHFLD